MAGKTLVHALATPLLGMVIAIGLIACGGSGPTLYGQSGVAGSQTAARMSAPTLEGSAIMAHAGEELWIIATPGETGEADGANEDGSPGTGSMLASFSPDGDDPSGRTDGLPLPLRHTDVRARIVGYVSTVDVVQQFENPFDRKIEAVYVFPLPEKSAVSEFVMSIGERRIRGILREREEAEAIYAQARAQGYRASLLTQHRPNIFEQKVANIERAKRYVQSIEGSGGTMMIEGIRAALQFPHDRRRLRFVTFLTDGYIGNEAEILREIHASIGESRIFSFGVGSSVNRYLLERMAVAGRGAVAYLGLDDSGSEVMEDFFGRISQPALSYVSIDWGDMRVSDVYPARLPDLFVGRPVIVTGRYRGEPDNLYVRGRTVGGRIEFGVQRDGHEPVHSFLPQIWARLRIADLMDRQVWEADPYGELEGMIRQTALDYDLMSDYTAFVAVDASQPTTGDYGVTVVQPVPVPSGVRFETTVP